MLLDSISAIQKAKLSGQLAQTIKSLQAEPSALNRIPLAKTATELIKKLTGDSVGSEQQEYRASNGEVWLITKKQGIVDSFYSGTLTTDPNVNEVKAASADEVKSAIESQIAAVSAMKLAVPDAEVAERMGFTDGKKGEKDKPEWYSSAGSEIQAAYNEGYAGGTEWANKKNASASAQAPQPDDGLSDDPNSPNYRYRDTGYIAGSRKEAAEAMIRKAKASGTMLRATDLDWEEIERNPRAAKELITKSNLFGKVDWQTLRSDGMEPAAGFLIDRIYASIAKEPEGEESSKLRQLYSQGLESIRNRLESCKTTDQVLSVLQEIRDEIEGVNLTAEEADEYSRMKERADALMDQYKSLNKEFVEKEQVVKKLFRESSALNYDIGKRRSRGWKDDPVLNANYENAKSQYEQAKAELEKWKAENPLAWNEQTMESFKEADGTRFEYHNSNPLLNERTSLNTQMRAMIEKAKIRNIGQDTSRAWLTLGDGFLKNIYWRRTGNAFAGHVTNARNGKIPSWDWAEKEKTTMKQATKREVTFQLRVASRYERKGGKPVSVSSTVDLEKMIGFRAIQSGKWVLDDPASAKFHVEQTAAAMSDLSDLVGIDMQSLGLNGRLGMAFGARGRGNAGWGGAAAAHYEPVERVINLTKQSGGGALAHEWVHSMDNLLPELLGIKVSGKDDFISENLSVLPEGKIKAAFSKLVAEMTTGDIPTREGFKITEKDRRLAKYNIDNPRNSVARMIKDAGNAVDAVGAIDAYYAKYTGNKRMDKQWKDWRNLAVAYYDTEGRDVVVLPTGYKTSSFKIGAIDLDGGKAKSYWATNKEMFARAFQSYVEDKLAEQDRQNDYLSIYADNKYHVDQLLGIEWKPYPEGEERKRINAAFDEVFAAIREEKVFEKASQNKELLDSIFGAEIEDPVFDGIDLKSGHFGPVWAGFENDPEGAIEKLLNEQAGEITGAYRHPELGRIGFVYGDNNFGLKHIISKRGVSFVRSIPKILRTGRLVREPALKKAYLVTDDVPPRVAVVRMEFNGESKVWIVTACFDEQNKF